MYFSFNDISSAVRHTEKISCVYFIRSRINGGIYVGSTRDLYKRMVQHKSRLLHRKSCNPKLQNAVNKYGLDQFEFCMWEECEPDILASQECFWIGQVDSIYNLQRFPIRSGQTKPHSVATKRKLSAMRVGVPVSAEHAQRNRAAALGYRRTPEACRSTAVNNPNRRPVVCVDSGEVYESANAAARALQLHATTIVQVCRGRIKTTGGFKFTYHAPNGPQ